MYFVFYHAILDASWIRDIRVTDVTTTSAVIQYTTADCVLSSDLIVELITPNSSNYVHHYENETTSSFSLISLTPNDVVSFTLEVTISSTKLFGITSSFILLPTTTSQGKEHSLIPFLCLLVTEIFIDLVQNFTSLDTMSKHRKTMLFVIALAMFGTQIILFFCVPDPTV